MQPACTVGMKAFNIGSTTHASMDPTPPDPVDKVGHSICLQECICKPSVPAERLWVQGMELGLQTLAAAGAVMLVTLQGGKREASRFQAERDKAGDMTNQHAFNSYLRGVRKTGASHPKAEAAAVGDTAD